MIDDIVRNDDFEGRIREGQGLAADREGSGAPLPGRELLPIMIGERIHPDRFLRAEEEDVAVRARTDLEDSRFLADRHDRRQPLAKRARALREMVDEKRLASPQLLGLALLVGKLADERALRPPGVRPLPPASELR